MTAIDEKCYEFEREQNGIHEGGKGKEHWQNYIIISKYKISICLKERLEIWFIKEEYLLNYSEDLASFSSSHIDGHVCHTLPPKAWSSISKVRQGKH